MTELISMEVPTVLTPGVVYATPARLHRVYASDLVEIADDVAFTNPITLTGGVKHSYAGFNWVGDLLWAALNCDPAFPAYAAGYANTFAPPSLSQAIATDFGDQLIEMTAVEPFDFIEAYFASLGFGNAYAAFSAHNLTIRGYLNGVLIDTFGPFVLDPTAFVLKSVNILGVNKLEFESDGAGLFWMMDNFTYSNPYTPVPVVLNFDDIPVTPLGPGDTSWGEIENTYALTNGALNSAPFIRTKYSSPVTVVCKLR